MWASREYRRNGGLLCSGVGGPLDVPRIWCWSGNAQTGILHGKPWKCGEAADPFVYRDELREGGEGWAISRRIA